MLIGSVREWDDLRVNFKVQNDFYNELIEISRVTELLAQTDIFGGKYLTPLVNSFTELKNACIFYLAHRGIYEFNKSKCFDLAVGFVDRDVQFKELKAFYDFSIRGVNVRLPFNPDDEVISISLLMDIDVIVREMCNASK